MQLYLFKANFFDKTLKLIYFMINGVFTYRTLMLSILGCFI